MEASLSILCARTKRKTSQDERPAWSRYRVSKRQCGVVERPEESDWREAPQGVAPGGASEGNGLRQRYMTTRSPHIKLAECLLILCGTD